MTSSPIQRQIRRLVKPTPVVPGVFQLRALGAKVSVILGPGGEAILVDAGSRGSLRLINAGLRELEIAPQRVRLVVLTHNHPDHSGGLAALVEATGARVAVHRDDASMVSRDTPVENPFRNPVLSGITRRVIPPLHGDPVNVDIVLEGGEPLPDAGDFRVIHTPGHTPGSICLHSATRRLLIVGDALQYRFGELSAPAMAVTQDHLQAIDSLKALLPLQFDVICFSHFAPLRRQAYAELQRLVYRKTAAASTRRRARPPG